MRWMVAIAACAACSSDGGAGANLETVAELPRLSIPVLGFEADGTPLLGDAFSASPILRLDGGAWSPHPLTNRLRVSAFGLDLDGATLLVHVTGSTGAQEVLRLGPGGASMSLGLVQSFGSVRAVFQHVSGSRFVIGDQTMILRPGAASWALFPLRMTFPHRGPGGALYVGASTGVYRLMPDDTTVLVASCQVAPCDVFSGYGVDAGGRFYFDRTSSLTIFDEAQGAIASVQIPGPRDIHAFALTERQSLVVSEVVQGGRGAFVVGGEEAGFAIVPAHTPRPLSGQQVSVHVDPAGIIYLAQDDWLGRVALP